MKALLSLSLRKRRKIVVVDEEEIQNAKKPMVPKNTRKDILKDEPENLAHWLCVFVSEIRKGDDDFYAPNSITNFGGVGVFFK